jgi:hypothetical protein
VKHFPRHYGELVVGMAVLGPSADWMTHRGHGRPVAA